VWSNGTNTFQKYQVSMANGDSPTFLAKGEFKKSVGQDITYEKNEKYNTAKMIQDTPQFQPRHLNKRRMYKLTLSDNLCSKQQSIITQDTLWM
jgi:hypothetical protein